jgi:hypothetical protein
MATSAIANIIRITIGMFLAPRKGARAMIGSRRARVRKKRERTVAGCRLGRERSRDT